MRYVVDIETTSACDLPSIDNILVTGNSIAYGLSSDEDFTGQPCRAQWFSATDFKLIRIGDLPKK